MKVHVTIYEYVLVNRSAFRFYSNSGHLNILLKYKLWNVMKSFEFNIPLQVLRSYTQKVPTNPKLRFDRILLS